MKKTIYLSPHLDDVTLSCGGSVFHQSCQGDQVEVWTFTAGKPNPQDLPKVARLLHQRWGTDESAVSIRRDEDLAACKVLGANAIHLDWLDCIYRFKENGDSLVQSESDIFNAKPEMELVREIAAYLKNTVPDDAQLVSPLGIGGHIDHLLIVEAVRLSQIKTLFYADYPYVSYHLESLAFLESTDWERLPGVISSGGLEAWQNAIAAYTSQISTFWRDVNEMTLAIANYCAGGGGRLWRRK